MPSSEPSKISIVILNWNRPEDTLEAVRTTLLQDYPDFEILVWDNASTDDSRRVLSNAFSHEPRVRLLWGDKNYGVAGGRNRAFREAAGRILFSLDSDAVIETHDGLRKISALFVSEPDIGALSFEVRRLDRHLMWPFSRPASQWQNHRFDTIRVDGCSFATPRSVFDRIGGFAEHFSPYGAEDQYYAYQVLSEGFRIVYDPSIKIVHAFTPKARHGRQFAMHVRNMIWMPLELFPLRHALTRAGVQTFRLAREALEQKNYTSYLHGAFSGWIGAWWIRRKSMSQKGWNQLIHLIAEDKRLTQAKMPVEHGIRMS